MATQVKTDLIANNAITDAKIANVAITGVTASSGDSSTALATTAFVAGEINNLIDSAPGALNTLNELAAAMGDDANFSTTITNSIATKLPLAGGTLTGNLKVDASFTVNGNVDTSASLGEVLQLSQTDGAGAFLWSVDRSNNSYKTMNYHAGQHKFYTDASNLILTLSPTNNSATFAGRIQPNNHIIFQTGTSYIQFPAAGSRAWAIASGGGTAAPGTNSATFGFHHWSGSAWSNPINITASGKLGIGTDNPDYNLHVINSGSGDSAIGIKSTSAGDPTLYFDSAVANRSGIIRFMDQGSMVGGRIQYVHNGDRMDFQSGSSTGASLSIKNGSVGIGDSSSSLINAPLHVAKDMGNSVSAIIRLRGTNSTARTTRLQFEDYSGAIADGLIDFVIPTAGSSTGAYLGMGYNSSSQLQLYNGSTQLSGNVGIGGSPTNQLQVFGGGGDSRIQFTNNATGNGYSDGLWVGIDSTQGYLLHRENTPLSFFTNSSKKMTLTENGDLGLTGTGGVTAPTHFENLYITSTTGSNAGWSISTNQGTFNAYGMVHTAGIRNTHVYKWGFSGNLSANTWYQFAKRSELASYGPNTGSGSEDGFAMYFRIYTYTSTSGWGEYLAHRVTNTCWIANVGSNSVEEQHFIIGPALGHAPNGGQGFPKSGTTMTPIQMRIHHRMGSNDHPNSDQTFEIKLAGAVTGLNPTVVGRQLLIYGYIL